MVALKRTLVYTVLLYEVAHRENVRDESGRTRAVHLAHTIVVGLNTKRYEVVVALACACRHELLTEQYACILCICVVGGLDLLKQVGVT